VQFSAELVLMKASRIWSIDILTLMTKIQFIDGFE